MPRWSRPGTLMMSKFVAEPSAGARLAERRRPGTAGTGFTVRVWQTGARPCRSRVSTAPSFAVR